ncbi:hypothetical protein CONPUDRAFT_149685 [Coniophora puteana RWD-64-598 SS2]|uniref:Uncharacterized protein n=1 Tax=Coniophora puteana (strain RWD-64-598) TaxID=741705 RepID=A0A5M3N0P6_CONPW|nr:uncharacterized protein CONPUDRAFT_149685 [Coniophora puteana RWD-64-598 SS2]EIW84817.1 hypothetical protein CONPUDRAFT_149685 [Coniophora puteana RWD-64-598 SS2]
MAASAPGLKARSAMNGASELPPSSNENGMPSKSLQELANVLVQVGGKVNDIIKSNTLASFEQTNHSAFTSEENAEALRFLSEASPTWNHPYTPANDSCRLLDASP